jgi:hypothetical protein
MAFQLDPLPTAAKVVGAFFVEFHLAVHAHHIRDDLAFVFDSGFVAPSAIDLHVFPNTHDVP